MFHMINDQIEAYRRAVRDTARAQCLTDLNPSSTNHQEYRNCFEEEQLRLDGLKSVIGMALQDYATQQPFNPFSINGDVNQGVLASIADAISDDPEPDWRDSLSDAADCLRATTTPPVQPRSRLAQAMHDDPQVRTDRNQYGTFPPTKQDK